MRRRAALPSMLRRPRGAAPVAAALLLRRCHPRHHTAHTHATHTSSPTTSPHPNLPVPSLSRSPPLPLPPRQFFFYWLIMLLNLSVFLAFGMLAVHLTPQLEAANALAGTCFALYNLFCGFMK